MVRLVIIFVGAVSVVISSCILGSASAVGSSVQILVVIGPGPARPTILVVVGSGPAVSRSSRSGASGLRASCSMRAPAVLYSFEV